MEATLWSDDDRRVTNRLKDAVFPQRCCCLAQRDSCNETLEKDTNADTQILLNARNIRARILISISGDLIRDSTARLTSIGKSRGSKEQENVLPEENFSNNEFLAHEISLERSSRSRGEHAIRSDLSSRYSSKENVGTKRHCCGQS